MNKNVIMPIVVLMAICVVISGALAATNMVTEPIIAEAARQAAMAALFEVVPAADDFTEVEGLALPAGANAVHKAVNGAGYAILVNGKGGYGGDIVMAVGIDNDGKIIETKVISHQETSGLGSKVGEADFRKQFPGMDSSLSGFSAIGGVTVSSNAFKNGLTAAFAAFELAK